MRRSRLAIAASMLACLALPAAAQTMQTSPATPASPSISPSARTGTGSAGTGPAAAPAMRTTTAVRPPARTAVSSSLVDINSASVRQLDALPGIGKQRADAIIRNRPYRGKDDLVDRHILPSNVYNGIKDKIIARQG